jgi:hypothetical protein
VGNLNGRVRRLAQKHLAPVEDEGGKRARTEARRAEIRATCQRVIEQEERKGNPAPSPEQTEAAYQKLRRALERSRQAGLGRARGA